MNPQFFPHSVFFTLAQTLPFCPRFVGNQPSKSLWSPFPALTLPAQGTVTSPEQISPKMTLKLGFTSKRGFGGGDAK